MKNKRKNGVPSFAFGQEVRLIKTLRVTEFTVYRRGSVGRVVGSMNGHILVHMRRDDKEKQYTVFQKVSHKDVMLHNNIP